MRSIQIRQEFIPVLPFEMGVFHNFLSYCFGLSKKPCTLFNCMFINSLIVLTQMVPFSV